MKGLFLMRKLWAYAVVGLTGWSSVLWAGRPLVTNDAEPVEFGKLQLEAGVDYCGDSACDHFDAPLTLTYGVARRVEVGIGLGGQYESRKTDGGGTDCESGWSDLSLCAKWKLLDQEKAFFDQAIAAAVKIPTADHDRGLGSGKVDYDLTYVLTRELNEQTSVLFNVGYTLVGEHDDSDVLHYGPAITYQLTPRLCPVAEVLFETPVDGGETSIGTNAGLRYQLGESLTLDAAVGTRITGDWPHWTATLGLTWVF
jgi:hypothetical protein